MIDIQNRQGLVHKLKGLKSDSDPVWGRMTAQHMVEHLAFAVMSSNGALDQKLYFPKEKAEQIKRAVIYTDNELPMGFKAPMLGDTLPKLVCSDLGAALKKLYLALDEFELYFLNNPDAKPVNLAMGELDREEWTRFHNKHFSHHFKQFRLL
ncbi:DUF1569 domain-containing protein [Cytophagaceae bacterium ABcell3]|nr:DUF1569 domain-containing protein [Cytophagaceae bacterium ABcell3]